MATITISYNSSRFRVKLTPSMVLSEVIPQSLEHFKLLREGTGSKWGLFHNGRSVELDTPWRLLNLPAGVHLELKPSSDNSFTDKIIRIKIQTPGNGSKVKSVNINSRVQQLLDELFPVLDAGAKLQLLTRIVPVTDVNNHTWKSLGIVGSTSVRIILPSQASEVGMRNSNVDTKDTNPVQQEDRREENSRLHQIFAYVPSNKSLASELNSEQEDKTAIDGPELTIDHAKRYQKMVQRQAGGLGGAMIPRRIREQQEAATTAVRRRIIRECLIRVRFPDRTHIEVAFRDDDVISTVYGVVLDSLRDRDMKFTLYHSRPHVALLSNEQKLVHDLQFGPRTLLLFESDSKGPFLKESILNQARNLSDANDVQLDRSDKYETITKPEMPESKPKRTDTPGKYPKWLKLSKK